MSCHPRVRTIAAILLVAGSVRANAQHSSPLHRGGWIISGGGSIGRTHNDAVDNDVTHVAIQPTGLVFVSRHVAVGASLPLSYASFSNPSGHEYEYGIGPSARYYFQADTSAWLPFVSAAAQPEWQKVHRTALILTPPSGTPSLQVLDVENRVLNIDGSLGLTRLLAQHVGLTGELYYTHSSLHNNQGPRGTIGSYDAGARFGLTVFIN